MVIRDEGFSWFDDAMEVDYNEFPVVETKDSPYVKLFNLVVLIFWYLSPTMLLLYIVRSMLSSQHTIMYEVNVDTVILAISVYSTLFIILTKLTTLLLTLFQHLKFYETHENLRKSQQLLITGLWSALGLYLFPYIYSDIKGISHVVLAFLQCGCLTSVAYGIASVILEYFYIYFIESALATKIKQVNKTETILRAFKEFCRGGVELSSETSLSCGCYNFICDPQNDDYHDSINMRNLGSMGKTSNIFFRPPEVFSLHDAKALARDTFVKVVGDEEEMTFDDFRTIFSHEDIAASAFADFDLDENELIPQKDFRDTVVRYFINKCRLQASFETSKGFVKITGDIVNVAILMILTLAYLVIFGIPIRELFALALSSALLLNFLISGVAKDVFYNLMLIVSHPFDVGDEVIIDQLDLVVYKIGFTSSSFIAQNGGEIKMMNSELWNKNIMNMTRAPEKIILFSFDVNPDSMTSNLLSEMKYRIQLSLKNRCRDFFEKFSIQSSSESNSDIDKLKCSLILRAKRYKSRDKKFNLRLEFTRIIRGLLNELNIK